MGPAALRRRRAAAQLLSERRRRSPEEIVGHLLAVQAQDLRSTRLALRARGDGFAAADVDRALEDGALVIGWLMRGTLHLVRREDYPWLLGLTAPARVTANRRRLGQEGVSMEQAERALEVVEGALAAGEPLTRAQLEERLAAHGQAAYHLLMLAGLRGIAALGPVRDGRPAFIRAPAGDSDRGSARAELARRYLAAHAPALATDLVAWAGLPLRDVRLSPQPAAQSGGQIPPRLLPAFDPYMLGWKDRTFAVPPEQARRVHPGGGMIRAVAIVDGAVVGTWDRRGLDLFARVPPSAERALEAELADVERFEAARDRVAAPLRRAWPRRA